MNNFRLYSMLIIYFFRNRDICEIQNKFFTFFYFLINNIIRIVHSILHIFNFDNFVMLMIKKIKRLKINNNLKIKYKRINVKCIIYTNNNWFTQHDCLQLIWDESHFWSFLWFLLMIVFYYHYCHHYHHHRHFHHHHHHHHHFHYHYQTSEIWFVMLYEILTRNCLKCNILAMICIKQTTRKTSEKAPFAKIWCNWQIVMIKVTIERIKRNTLSYF